MAWATNWWSLKCSLFTFISDELVISDELEVNMDKW